MYSSHYPHEAYSSAGDTKPSAEGKTQNAGAGLDGVVDNVEWSSECAGGHGVPRYPQQPSTSFQEQEADDD